MKKTLLLTSLVASMVAMAGTTGSVEAYNENEATFVKGAKPTFVAKKTGVKTEVKVNGTGFSFGGDFKAEDLELGKVKRANYLNHSSVWAKYELPELTKGLNMYVKGTVSPKFADEETNEYKFDGSAELEGQASYKYDMLTFGLNSKTNFPFRLSDGNVDYGKDVKSTHKVFVESEEKRDVYVKGLRDVKANLEIKHNYAKNVAKAGDRVDYVSGHLGAAYEGVKDLRLEGAFDFRVNVKEDGRKLEDTLKEFQKGNLAFDANLFYFDKYDFKAIYTGVKGLKLTVNPFIGHYNLLTSQDTRFDLVTYGTKLEAEYKMLNDKLTLKGRSTLAGDTFLKNGNVVSTHGVFKFGANAKYDYNVSDKFTVSPEADAEFDLYTLKAFGYSSKYYELTLTPKVSAEYKPTDTLTLKGSVETPVKFKKVGNGFKYTDTQIKTSLNLKYEWK